MSASPRRWLWVVHFFNVIFLTGVTTRALVDWDRLPARVPVHFDFDGVADRWGEKGPELAAIFAMPWLVVGLLYAMHWAFGYLRRHPDSPRLPRSIRALPRERRVAVSIGLEDLLLALATATSLALGMLAWGSLQVALGVYPGLPPWTTFPWLGLLAATVVAGSIRLFVLTTH